MELASFRSGDGRVLNGPGLVDVHAMAVNPVNPAIIYVSAGSGVFQSVDYRENWAELVAFQTPVIPAPPLLRWIAEWRTRYCQFSRGGLYPSKRPVRQNGALQRVFFLENFLQEHRRRRELDRYHQPARERL
jgi:hypothetical protein